MKSIILWFIFIFLRAWDAGADKPCLQLPSPCILRVFGDFSQIHQDLGPVCDYPSFPKLHDSSYENTTDFDISSTPRFNTYCNTPLFSLSGWAETFAALDRLRIAFDPGSIVLFHTKSSQAGNKIMADIARNIIEENMPMIHPTFLLHHYAWNRNELGSVWSIHCFTCGNRKPLHLGIAEDKPDLTSQHIHRIRSEIAAYFPSQFQLYSLKSLDERCINEDIILLHKCNLVVGPITKIVLSCLNLTYMDISSPPEFAGFGNGQDLLGGFLIDGTEIFEEDVKPYSRQDIILHKTSAFKFTFSYCQKLDRFLPPLWGIFLKPFFPTIWISILLIVASLSFLLHPYTLQEFLYFPIHTLIYLIGGEQMRGKKALVSGVMALSSLLFILIVNLYLGDITSDFISPPDDQKYRNLSQLLENGYRFLRTEDSMPFFMFFGDKTQSKVGKNREIVGSDFMLRSVPTLGFAHFDAMVKHKGVFQIPSGKYVTPIISHGGSFTVRGSKCFLLDLEQDIEGSVTVVAAEHKAKLFGRMLKYIEEAGLPLLWFDRGIWKGLQHLDDAGIFETRGESGDVSLPMSSHIKMLFYYWVIGLGLTAGVLAFECKELIIEWGKTFGRTCKGCFKRMKVAVRNRLRVVARTFAK